MFETARGMQHQGVPAWMLWRYGNAGRDNA